MKNKLYLEEQYRQKFNASAFGAVLTLGINLGLIMTCSFSGLKYIYPPPEEKSLLIEFEEQQAPKITVKKYGREPSAEEADPKNKLEFVQKSKAQYKGTKQNLAKASTVGPEGDVDVPEPPREEEIDSRSLFHSAHNTDKDTLAAQTAREVSDALKAGHAKGNAEDSRIEGIPTARVKGRSTVGVLPKPSYGIQAEGTVVVEIWVDKQGSVIRAIPGADGTTATKNELWNAARKAAMKAKFNNVNSNLDMPEQMKGTITYIFKLK